MTDIPFVDWKDIAGENVVEPEDLGDLFHYLFLTDVNENSHYNDITQVNITSVQFFTNKLISIRQKEINEEFFDLLSYSLFVATYFTLRKEYKQAIHVLKWLEIEQFLIRLKEKDLNDNTALYSSVLYYFLKNEMEVLTEEDIECFTFFTFNNLSDNVHFGIESNIFNNLWHTQMPIADFFGWSFKVLDNNLEQVAQQNDFPVEEVLASYLDGLIDMYSIGLKINESNLLEDVLGSIYIKLDNSFLRNSVELFINDITTHEIKDYIKSIKKDMLSSYETLLKKYINNIFKYYIPDDEGLFVFLKEISRKKYLRSLLEFTYDTKTMFDINYVVKRLIKLERNEALQLSLSIFNWLEVEVKNKILEENPFYLSFLHSQIGDKKYAINLYASILDKKPDSIAVINNLAVLYYEYLKDYDSALSLLKKGEELDAEDEYIQKNIKIVSELIEEERKRPEKIKDRYFKKINKLQRSILFAIYKLSGDGPVTSDLIQSVTKLTDSKFYTKNINTLIDLELISHDNGKGYILDSTVYELIKDYVNPKIEREVVKASQNSYYRPIFFHESEIRLYQALIELFPQQLVFPNMDLKAIIDVNKVKPYLDPDVVDYMFKAHVDFAIINNTNYLPILCIEKDSSFQDDSYGANNALKKNIIFSTSGLPLIRIRYSSSMDSDRLREEVKQATKEFLLQTYKDNDTRDILREFDLKRFGIYIDLPTEEEIRITWEEIVGEVIYNQTKEIKLEKKEAILYIYLSTSSKQIIELGKEGMKTGLYHKYPNLNAIEFVFV